MISAGGSDSTDQEERESVGTLAVSAGSLSLQLTTDGSAERSLLAQILGQDGA